MNHEATGGLWVVTGHRPRALPVRGVDPYGPEHREVLQHFAAACFEDVRPDVVVTGMALGWDMACAAAAASMGIPFVAALPHDHHGATWPEDARDRRALLLGRAAEVVVVNPGTYTPGKMHARNAWMCDRAAAAGGRILALCDPTTTTGGTVTCMAAGEAMGVPVVRVWDRWAVWPMEMALRMVLDHDNRRMARWADRYMDGHPTVADDLRAGYRPTHREASAYRGALVAVHRGLAQWALEAVR